MDRKREIALAVADVREIEKRDGVTRQSLEKIKQRLIRLARPELFPASDFPPPAAGGKLKSCLYRVSEDADHRYALYVNASLGGHGTPAHNHTTWAVIVGVTGEELNRFYDRAAEGPPLQKGEYLVKQGTGVCFMPEDLHSIHIQAPLVNFHMYGLALDQLHSREYYQAAERTWKVFPAHGDIREAR
jgi:predicted metal-dependent enzyme (double-stranded beta helix superfamily)